MRMLRFFCCCSLAFLAFLASASLHAQQSPPAKDSHASIPTQRLTVEVTGGEANKPVENASVYLKTEEEHLIKNKKTEENVKTNQQGIAHIPQPPTGRVLVQVVADGWKPFGRWFDVSDPKQVIKVHLDRPPKWY